MRYDLIDDNYTTHEHDVVVIGAGGAGLRAAGEAPGRSVRRALEG